MTWENDAEVIRNVTGALLLIKEWSQNNDLEIDRVSSDKVLAAAARYYHHGLNGVTREYLKKNRGLTEETISQLQIGFGRDGLFDYLYNRCWFSLNECRNAGVITLLNGECREFFRGYLTLPCFESERVVDITAWVMTD